jgi:hypothetical protein
MQPHILYAGYRGHASGLIYSWDIRANVDAPLEIFRKAPPPSTSTAEGGMQRTNQRMHFDVDVAGRLLSVGDQVRGSLLFIHAEAFYLMDVVIGWKYIRL